MVPCCGRHIDHATLGVGSVQVRIRPAIDLAPFHPRCRKRPKVESATQITGIHAINEHQVVIRVAPADEQRTLRPALAGLRHKRSRHQPEQAHRVLRQLQLSGANHAGCRARLRLRCRCSCRRHHDRLAYPLRLQHDILLDTVELSCIEPRRLKLTKLRGVHHEIEPPALPSEDLKTSVRTGNRGARDLPVGDQVDRSSGHTGPGSVGDHTANRSGMSRDRKKQNSIGTHARQANKRPENKR